MKRENHSDWPKVARTAIFGIVIALALGSAFAQYAPPSGWGGMDPPQEEERDAYPEHLYAWFGGSPNPPFWNEHAPPDNSTSATPRLDRLLADLRARNLEASGGEGPGTLPPLASGTPSSLPPLLDVAISGVTYKQLEGEPEGDFLRSVERAAGSYSGATAGQCGTFMKMKVYNPYPGAPEVIVPGLVIVDTVYVQGSGSNLGAAVAAKNAAWAALVNDGWVYTGPGSCSSSNTYVPPADDDTVLTNRYEDDFVYGAGGETEFDWYVIFNAPGPQQTASRGPPRQGEGYASGNDLDDIGVLPRVHIDILDVLWADGTQGYAAVSGGYLLGAWIEGVWVLPWNVPPIPAEAGWPCTIFEIPADPDSGGGPPSHSTLPNAVGATLEEAVWLWDVMTDGLKVVSVNGGC